MNESLLKGMLTNKHTQSDTSLQFEFRLNTFFWLLHKEQDGYTLIKMTTVYFTRRVYISMQTVVTSFHAEKK